MVSTVLLCVQTHRKKELDVQQIQTVCQYVLWETINAGLRLMILEQEVEKRLITG